ncbi:hypothetical protein [Bifidobacterium bombi]|uniref:Uncharacterized protein n=2 Tax=Bifidobacterium bombi TaxID=471511 RepID=A0A086BNP4_9BIFI|nr:hypothetical protein [Bifidobacterium bombi]KFF30558.1 hypothetical protein BBOMB_1418 [Bifidobacterium bombi DSM 19703]
MTGYDLRQYSFGEALGPVSCSESTLRRKLNENGHGLGATKLKLPTRSTSGSTMNGSTAMTHPSNSPKRRRRWPRVLAVFLTVVLAFGAWGGWHAWRTSLPVSHAHNDPMTVQMRAMFKSYPHLRDAIKASGSEHIQYREESLDTWRQYAYADIRMNGKIVEVSSASFEEEETQYEVSFYPNKANPATDECSSSLWLSNKTAGYFEDCSTGKEEQSSLGMSRTQQEQLARKACWKLIDTAVAHW